MSKIISAVVMGQGTSEVKEVKIEKGVTLKEFLEKLNLDAQSKVWRPKTNEPIKPHVDLHQLLEDKEKVQITPIAEVGTGF